MSTPEYRFKEIGKGLVEVYWFGQLVQTLKTEKALDKFHHLRDRAIKELLTSHSNGFVY